MYLPRHFTASDEAEIEAFVDSAAAADLVTFDGTKPVASLIPVLWDRSGEKHVRPDDWNTYVIEAIGPRVRTWINGQLCVDLEDAKLSRRGIFGLQLHSGGPMEVRFKDIKLEVLTPGK